MNVNSLQDVFTSKCLVPEAGELNPADETLLVERAACGEGYSNFALKSKLTEKVQKQTNRRQVEKRYLGRQKDRPET